MAGHVFICYARKNQNFVLKLATTLKERNVPVWLDQWHISPSADWDRAIDEAIDDCTHFLIILSPEAIKSREVRGELRAALDANKPIVPVLYQHCRLPRQLRMIQYVDYTPQGPGETTTLRQLLRFLSEPETMTPIRDFPSRSLEPKPELVAPAKTRSSHSPESPPTSSASVDHVAPSATPQPRSVNWSLVGGGLLSVIILGVIILGAILFFFLLMVNNVGERIQVLMDPIKDPVAEQTEPSFGVGAETDIPSPTPTRSPTPSTFFSKTITAADDSPMVLVPAGRFKMGSDNGNPNEQPLHDVTLDAFYIDQYEITNAQFRHCIGAKICREPTTCDWGEPTYNDESKQNHPVVCVSWDQAKTYCEWRGDRLPTEAEWEKAARGTDGRTYPWGDNFPDGTLLNFNNNVGGAIPVGSYPNGISAFGAYDMAGNVWEWVSDWYDEDYYATAPPVNPPGPDQGALKVLRGGGWEDNHDLVRATYRLDRDPDIQFADVGFRCAR